jgi:hypothetical protein
MLKQTSMPRPTIVMDSCLQGEFKVLLDHPQEMLIPYGVAIEECASIHSAQDWARIQKVT